MSRLNDYRQFKLKYDVEDKVLVLQIALSVFGFRLTIQNTANRHVSNAFDLIAVFISFPGFTSDFS